MQNRKGASDVIVEVTSAESAIPIGRIARFPPSAYAVQRQVPEKLLVFACQPGMLSPKFATRNRGSLSNVQGPNLGTDDHQSKHAGLGAYLEV